MTESVEDLHQRLVAAADSSSPCQRVLRHHEGRKVATTPRDFYRALRTVEELVVRVTGAVAASDVPATADYRSQPGFVEFTTTADHDPVLTGRENFEQAVRVSDDVEVLATSDSWFTRDDSYRARIEDPRGLVDTIADDLRRCTHDHASACRIECDGDDVVVEADGDVAADWLYEWLEDSVTHYREEYVDATMEHDAARQLRDVVYEEFVQADDDGVDRELATDGGADLPEIAFATEYVEPILEREKTVTIRFDFEHDFDPMDRVRLLDEDGTEFATARIVTQCELRADWVSFADFAGHHRYPTTSDLLDELAEYYPDANIEPGWVLDVIAFHVEDATLEAGGETVMTDGGELPSETHIDEDRGLWIPPELREFDRQIIIRTPSGTVQHFGESPLGPYYGLVTDRDFGEVDELYDPKNPDLAPDHVRIKPEGEDAVELSVDLSPDIRADGGTVVDDDLSVQDAVFDALDRHSDQDGKAQAGDVVADVLVETQYGVGAVCSCIHRLHATGEIYQPNATEVKRVEEAGSDD